MSNDESLDMNVAISRKKIMTKYVVLKLTDEKWQGKKVNEKSVNWQCALRIVQYHDFGCGLSF